MKAALIIWNMVNTVCWSMREMVLSTGCFLRPEFFTAWLLCEVVANWLCRESSGMGFVFRIADMNFKIPVTTESYCKFDYPIRPMNIRLDQISPMMYDITVMSNYSQLVTGSSSSVPQCIGVTQLHTASSFPMSPDLYCTSLSTYFCPHCKQA